MSQQPLFFELAEGGQRLDRYLADQLPSLSRNMVQQLIEQGGVQVNGGAVKKNLRLAAGDRIAVVLPEKAPPGVVPEQIKLDIVYDDSYLLVVNKPKGMVVHPGAGNSAGTLAAAALAYTGGRLSGVGGPLRPGIVHRIDKDTSGLLVMAKTDETHLKLAEQLAAHGMHRRYEAVAHGIFAENSGQVEGRIGRDLEKRTRMADVQKGGKAAVTHYTVLRRFDKFTHLSLQLETGRTHQIRVHMAKLGHPLAGDLVYGPGRSALGLKGQCLHAAELGFLHPMYNVFMQFVAPLPEEFATFLRRLEGEGEDV